jgi:hypothetical protein
MSGDNEANLEDVAEMLLGILARGIRLRPLVVVEPNKVTDFDSLFPFHRLGSVFPGTSKQ